MADSARQSHRTQLIAVVVEEPDNANHCLLLDQRSSHRRIVEIHLAMLDCFDRRRRERIGIDFQAKSQCVARCESVDCLMKLKLVSPEGLIAEGIEAEDLSAALQQLTRILINIAEKCEAHIVF